MSRWAGISLKCPQINVLITQLPTEGDGSTTSFFARVDSVKNKGGILPTVLPLRRLSKYLTEHFVARITLNYKVRFTIRTEFLFPKLPRWLMGIMKLFVKKVSGTGIVLINDFVDRLREDVNGIKKKLL